MKEMALREGSLWDTEFGAADIDALNAAFNERAIWQSTLAAADAFWKPANRHVARWMPICSGPGT